MPAAIVSGKGVEFINDHRPYAAKQGAVVHPRGDHDCLKKLRCCQEDLRRIA